MTSSIERREPRARPIRSTFGEGLILAPAWIFFLVASEKRERREERGGEEGKRVQGIRASLADLPEEEKRQGESAHA